MQDTYCEKFGFTQAHIAQRLALLQLDHSCHEQAEYLRRIVIKPNLDDIVNTFYSILINDSEARSKLRDEQTRLRLRKTMCGYLLSLGEKFDTEDYFNHRLRIGLVHSWIGINLSLYQCSYRLLQQAIIDRIPGDEPRTAELIGYLLKITTLDMSLAIEAYHSTQLSSLEKFVDVERDKAEELKEKMRYDGLTKIFARESILELVENSLSVYQKTGAPFCVAMVDIDLFKLTNDTFGHLVGDKVLYDVAQRIKSSLRHGDAVGRYGGEEFLVVLGNTPIDTAITIAQRIRNNVSSAPFKAASQVVSTTVSLGIAETRHGEDFMSLIERADQALYRAKQNGRNRVER